VSCAGRGGLCLLPFRHPAQLPPSRGGGKQEGIFGPGQVFWTCPREVCIHLLFVSGPRRWQRAWRWALGRSGVLSPGRASQVLMESGFQALGLKPSDPTLEEATRANKDFNPFTYGAVTTSSRLWGPCPGRGAGPAAVRCRRGRGARFRPDPLCAGPLPSLPLPAVRGVAVAAGEVRRARGRAGAGGGAVRWGRWAWGSLRRCFSRAFPSAGAAATCCGDRRGR